MSPLSTKEVAQLVGISPRTLLRWLREHKINPKTISFGRRIQRIWTEAKIEKLRRVKKEIYRKGRGRKKGGAHKHE